MYSFPGIFDLSMRTVIGQGSDHASYEWLRSMCSFAFASSQSMSRVEQLNDMKSCLSQHAYWRVC